MPATSSNGSTPKGEHRLANRPQTSAKSAIRQPWTSCARKATVSCRNSWNFLSELTKGLDELARALEARDYTAAAHLAHTLKGTAGTFGATHMHEVAAKIDQAARAGQADQATAMFAEFRSECERVRNYLAAEVTA